jgi:KaiC/GvpD/RAD55 family RecA-like ATPase
MSWLAQFRPAPAAPNGYANRPADFWTEWRGGGQGYAEAALARECDDVARAPQGQRNHTLNAAAFSLGQLVAGGALGRDRVVDALMGAARQVGLGQQETERTIASGLRSGAATPRGIPDRPASGLLVPAGTVPAAAVDEADGPSLADQVHEHLPLLDWDNLFTTEDDEEWIVEPLIPARRLVALYSPPKVGKSLLMLELAVHISRGTSVLGVTPDRPRRVLYVDFENDPRGDIRERLVAMGFGPKDLGGLAYLSFPALAALDTAAGGEQLKAAVDVYGCEVVVIDTISRAISGEENENDTWLAFYRHTGRAMKAAGVSLVRLDHTGKDETKGQRGGSAKSGDVDMVWRMSRVTDSMFRLDCEAHRMPVLEKTLVLHREVRPRMWHRVEAEGRYAAWRARLEEIVAALDGAGIARDAGRRVVREAVRAAGLRASDALLSEVIKKRRGIDVDED